MIARAIRRAKRPSPFSVNRSTSVVLGALVDDVGCGAAGGRIHPHVERGVPPVGKAAIGGIELRGAHPQIEEHSGHLGPGISGHGAQMLEDDGADAVETGPANGGPAPVGGQRDRGRLDGTGVPVDTEQPHLGVGVKEGDCVPGTPQRGIDDEPRGHRGEEVDDLVGHHRLVCERLGHPQPPDRHNACG